MIRFLKFLIALFTMPPKDHKKELNEYSEYLSTLYSSGNVTLQQGGFLTAPKIEKLRKEVLAYKF